MEKAQDKWQWSFEVGGTRQVCLKFMDHLPWPVTAVNKRPPFLLLLPVVLGLESQGKGKRVISAMNYSLSSA